MQLFAVGCPRRTDGTAPTATRLDATAPAGHDHADAGEIRQENHVVRVRDLGGGLTEFTVARRVPARPTG